jgi:hypothetical protein
MNLKETIISSFFFHSVIFLLMLALSSYRATGFSGNFQNIVSVDLTSEKDLRNDESNSVEVPPLVAGPPSVEEASLTDETVNIIPEESKETAEPEKKVETDAGPPKIETAEKPPSEREGPSSMEAYHQFVMLHKKIFGQKAGVRVNELLGEALKVNTRNFYGGTALISLKFGPDRKLSEVYVDSDSPDLKAFFEEFVWDTVPAPAQFSLGFTGVQIEFQVLQGYMSFKIDAL